MSGRRIIYRVHAIQRMLDRGVSTDDIRTVLEHGEVIDLYPDDKPYPSRLLLAFVGQRPLHMVAADNPLGNETFIITVYEPDPEVWDSSLRKRR